MFLHASPRVEMRERLHILRVSHWHAVVMTNRNDSREWREGFQGVATDLLWELVSDSPVEPVTLPSPTCAHPDLHSPEIPGHVCELASVSRQC